MVTIGKIIGVVAVNRVQSKVCYKRLDCKLNYYHFSRASSPNQNWNGSWGYQSDIQGYQSENTDYSYSSKPTSPQGEGQVRKNSKKEKKKDERKPDWNSSKWGDDELWESLNN